MRTNLKKITNNSIKFLLIFLLVFEVHGQEVYKTPSGKKYHLSSCRMVENVSRKLVNNDVISDYNLQPCKICNPPIFSNLVNGLSSNNKATGESISVQCKGKTQKGTRCKHVTKLANGYCYQHTEQNSSNNIYNKSNINANNSTICGARTKSGGYCKRKVKNGFLCYQHQ